VVQPFFLYILFCNDYLNPTLACQTNANKKNNTGITGITSAKGPKIAKTPGSLLNKILSIQILNLNIFLLIITTIIMI